MSKPCLKVVSLPAIRCGLLGACGRTPCDQPQSWSRAFWKLTESFGDLAILVRCTLGSPEGKSIFLQSRRVAESQSYPLQVSRELVVVQPRLRVPWEAFRPVKWCRNPLSVARWHCYWGAHGGGNGRRTHQGLPPPPAARKAEPRGKTSKQCRKRQFSRAIQSGSVMSCLLRFCVASNLGEAVL